MASTAPVETRLPLLLDPKTVEQHSLRRDEPDWLRQARLEASRRLGSDSWPTGEEEEWRRFPLKDLPTGSLVSTLDHLPGIQFKLEPQATAAGVIFKGLLRASLDNPELVRPHIAPGGGIPSHTAFRAIADALWSAGSTFVHVPVGVEVHQPLVLEKVWPAGDEAMLSRTIVVAERDSSLTLVEDLTSEGDAPRIAIPHVEVHAGAGAHVTYVGIRRFAPGVLDLGFQQFRSARDSELRSLNVFAGAGSVGSSAGTYTACTDVMAPCFVEVIRS